LSFHCKNGEKSIKKDGESSPPFQTVEKLKISMSRKGLGNEACPKWNPQAEFISAEEKPRFQGFAEQILHEEIGLYSSVLTRQNPDFDEGCRLFRHPEI
jgi:hypothetical protein